MGVIQRLRMFSPGHRSAIRTLVTPFTPYTISDFYLSCEIFTSGVRTLNWRSRNLRSHAQEVRDNDRIYCQVDLLPEFVTIHLPRINSRFVLITGQWQLPALSESALTEELVRSDKVNLWFSQNMTINHPKCQPFPYGVSHLSAPRVVAEMRQEELERTKGIYYGFVSVREHLPFDVKEARLALKDRMDRMLPLPQYLEKIHGHCFVASPEGDRPDTYRHWEAIALGSVPISNLPPGPYRTLFGPNMIYVDRMQDVLTMDPRKLDYARPDASFVQVSYWSDRINAMLG